MDISSNNQQVDAIRKIAMTMVIVETIFLIIGFMVLLTPKEVFTDGLAGLGFKIVRIEN